MDISIVISQIIYTLSSSAVSLSIPIIAIVILLTLQRRIEIRGFKFFMIGFISQVVLTIIGAILGIVPWLIFDTIPLTEVFMITYTIHMGVSLLLIPFSQIFLSLGFLSLLGYKTQVNGLAIAGAALSAVSLFVPWFATDTKLIAPTYTFPLETLPDSQWLPLSIIVALLNIATYSFAIGSAFSGRIGRILILVGGAFAFSSPFTYLLVFGRVVPWIGLVLPFISTIIAYFAFRYHPKELEKAVLDLTGFKA